MFVRRYESKSRGFAEISMLNHFTKTQSTRYKLSFKNELKANPFIRQVFIDNDDGKPPSIVCFSDEQILQIDYRKMIFQMGMSLEWIVCLLVSEEKNFKDFAFFLFVAMATRVMSIIKIYIFVEFT